MIERELVSVTISVPLVREQPEFKYQIEHVDVPLRKVGRQGYTLRRLLWSLEQRNAYMSDGRRVMSAADCVRWLLDQIDEALTEQVPQGENGKGDDSVTVNRQQQPNLAKPTKKAFAR